MLLKELCPELRAEVDSIWPCTKHQTHHMFLAHAGALPFTFLTNQAWREPFGSLLRQQLYVCQGLDTACVITCLLWNSVELKETEVRLCCGADPNLNREQPCEGLTISPLGSSLTTLITSEWESTQTQKNNFLTCELHFFLFCFVFSMAL